MSSVDLGCGERKRGDIGVDLRRVDGVDVIADVSQLPFREGSFVSAIASDIIEHFPRSETVKVLKEWKRVLADTGVLIIKTPNLFNLAKAYLTLGDSGYDIDSAEFSRKLYGNQGNEGDFHKAGFDPQLLRDLLTEAGFKIDRFYEIATDLTREVGDWSNQMVIVRKM